MMLALFVVELDLGGYGVDEVCVARRSDRFAERDGIFQATSIRDISETWV
jgi:hypothetical protein